MSNVITISRAQLFAGVSTAILATAMLSAPVQAQSIITDPTLDSVLQAHVTGGDTTAQRNTGAIDAQNNNFDATTTNTGGVTNGVFENNANTADATAIANRNGVTASLANIGSSTLLDDGIALSGVSVNTGVTAQVDATNSSAVIGTTLVDFATGSVDVSNNTTSANAVINEGSNTFALSITGSEPVGYTNLATTNAAVTTDLSGSATDVADLAGTLLVSSVQVADASVDSTATTIGSTTFVSISTTADANVTGTATLDGNDVTATFTANARDASITFAADDANTSVTAAISNAQSFVANSSAEAAFTIANTIRADISGPGTVTTSFLNSSLSVASNTIAAAANGNTATTQITLADGLAYDTVAANTASATIDGLGGSPTVAKLADVAASGGLVGVNTQIVTTGTLISFSDTNQVDVDVETPRDSSIDVSSNRITAAATGNNLTAGIASGDSSAVFDASAVLASRQELDTVVLRADSDDADVLVDVAGSNTAAFFDSTITVDANVLASSAVGNRARQTIELEATSLNAATANSADLDVDLAPSLSGEASIDADGAIIIASAMINTASSVTADNSSSDIDVTIGQTQSGNATNTSVDVTNNAQQAFAVGSDAGNSLSLMGVTVGSAAGIANLQTNDATSTVTATQDASVDVSYRGNLVSGSSEISGNTASAIARGTVAANTLTVDAQIVALGANGTDTNSTPTTLDATATAAFGVVNVQQVLGDVTATSTPDDVNAFRMHVVGGLTDASTTVNANTLMAQAQGTVAANTVMLDVGTLTSTDGQGDAAIANLQNVAGADIRASVNGDGNGAIETEIGTAVLRSSVETSNNRIMASAESARASNVLSISGTSLSGSSLIAFSDNQPLSDLNTVEAQFGVVNTQVAGSGEVIASLREAAGGAFENSSAVVTDLNDAVTSSSVASSGNLLQALASSNRATNAVNVDGTTLDKATSGLANAQVSEQDVSALTGFAGAAGTFNSGGVLVDVEGALTGSTIEVEDNAVQGSAIGNSAANSVMVTSTSADGVNTPSSARGTGGTRGSGGVFYTNATASPEAYAQANTSLSSTQALLSGSSSATEVFTTFGIDGALDTAITDATLSVSGNSAYGESIGNTVTNSLTVAGSDLAGVASTGVMSSAQSGVSAMSASSDMDVAANAVSSGSNVALDSNANNALGVVNNSTNTLTAASTNSASSVQAGGLSDVTNDIRAGTNSSFALLNGQRASGTLTTSANTSVYNIDSTNLATTGVVNGSLSIADNATRSESTANRTANTIAVGADANLGSSAILLTQQASSTTTTSNATSNIALGVSGTDPLEALDTSSVSVEGNTTLALARGNSASNTLNYTAGASYIAAVGVATVDGSNTRVQASAALLNDQSNTGSVSANATGRTSIALNATSAPTDAGVLNASVSNSNNSTTAFAVGNTAANTVMLSALNTGMANAALGNQQTSTGAVTAVASSVTYSIGSIGTFGASSFVNSGNAGTATAIGNSSVLIIGAN